MGIFTKDEEVAETSEAVEAKQPPEAEPEFPRKAASGSGGGRGYTVEARLNFNGSAEIINGIALGPNWARLHFERAAVGVPQGNVCWGHLPHTELLAYASAQALRWWFLANAEASRPAGSLCIETRLVRHDCSYSYKEEPVAAMYEIDKEFAP